MICYILWLSILLYVVNCDDMKKPDLRGFNESDPCYYIVKFNTDTDSVYFCQLTRGQWASRDVKNIFSEELLCNDVFQRHANLTLHNTLSATSWIYMKGCID